LRSRTFRQCHRDGIEVEECGRIDDG